MPVLQQEAPLTRKRAQRVRRAFGVGYFAIHFSGENLLMANQPLLCYLAMKATEIGEITQNDGH